MTQCPRCGSEVTVGARFCANCGLEFQGTTVQAGLIPPPPSLPYVPGDAQAAWAGTPPTGTRPVVPYASATAQAYSVVAALSPARPPGALFWVGLVLTILALVLVACPGLLAFAAVIDPNVNDPGSIVPGALYISCCLFVGLFAPGVLMIAIGRPRKSF